MKNYFKSLQVILTAIVLFGVTTAARAQFYSYNSFINGYNLVAQALVATNGATVVATYGSTNIDQAWGVNSYVYNGSYAATANNSYIGTNTVVTGTAAFGLQTNTSCILDARLWPDNNSDTSTSLGIFVALTPMNSSVSNVYTLVFESVVDVPINLPPPSPNSAVFPSVGGSGTITNSIGCNVTGNTFTLVMAVGNSATTAIVTNPPAYFMAGAAKARLLSITQAITNAMGTQTLTSYSSTLTNGVWQIQTNTSYSTNYGGVYVNAGVVGYPPFHSP